jgi:hypothetical protein
MVVGELRGGGLPYMVQRAASAAGQASRVLGKSRVN